MGFCQFCSSLWCRSFWLQLHTTQDVWDSLESPGWCIIECHGWQWHHATGGDPCPQDAMTRPTVQLVQDELQAQRVKKPSIVKGGKRGDPHSYRETLQVSDQVYDVSLIDKNAVQQIYRQQKPACELTTKEWKFQIWFLQFMLILKFLWHCIFTR